MTERFELLVLFAYPDPASPLAKELRRRGLWQRVLTGTPIPAEISTILGTPWTIGYGHTRNVKPGDKCTKEQADAWAMEDTAIAEADVNSHCKQLIDAGKMTQGMFDALVDFAFNLGCDSLNKSTLLRLVNTGDFQRAALEFRKWDHAGGVELAGLLERRLAEQQEFESTDA